MGNGLQVGPSGSCAGACALPSFARISETLKGISGEITQLCEEQEAEDAEQAAEEEARANADTSEPGTDVDIGGSDRTLNGSQKLSKVNDSTSDNNKTLPDFGNPGLNSSSQVIEPRLLAPPGPSATKRARHTQILAKLREWSSLKF